MTRTILRPEEGGREAGGAKLAPEQIRKLAAVGHELAEQDREVRVATRKLTCYRVEALRN